MILNLLEIYPYHPFPGDPFVVNIRLVSDERLAEIEEECVIEDSGPTSAENIFTRLGQHKIDYSKRRRLLASEMIDSWDHLKTDTKTQFKFSKSNLDLLCDKRQIIIKKVIDYHDKIKGGAADTKEHIIEGNSPSTSNSAAES